MTWTIRSSLAHQWVAAYLNITGYVGSAASQSTFANARVEFFKAAVDSSGYGEGQTYIGYLTTDGSGNFSGSLPGAVLTAGDQLTATATDSNNNTSEFGPNLQVTITPFSAFSVDDPCGSIEFDRQWRNRCRDRQRYRLSY